MSTMINSNNECRALHPDNDLRCGRRQHDASDVHECTVDGETIAWYGSQQEEAFREGTLGEVIDERVRVYGDPVDTFVRIAQVWTGILGHEVQPTDVPLMMMGMKMVRTTQAPDYSDNSDDIDGYLDIFRKLVGDDMIDARSVKEYIAERKSRGTW